MRSFLFPLLATASGVAASRYVVYFDQYHTASLPTKEVTAGITHVITAFASSSLFTTDPPGDYQPFMNVTQVRALFDRGTKRLGYDCVDVDWEYPGGNGEDYRKNPNSNKTSEIETFPLLLAEIKKAIPCKELSIAVPGREEDMIAYTAEQVPKINAAVDYINAMTYDLMNRRDNFTKHHTPIQGSLETVKTYISRGMTPSKMNLGLAFYAKWFMTAKGSTCTSPVGCPTELLEAADGTDTGKSGAMTFEAANFAPVPTNLTETTDGTCGAGTYAKCKASDCCGQYGFCGTEVGHCGTGCQSGFGRCEGVSTKDSFKKAVANAEYDSTNGGEWYWDAEGGIFWTWDTPSIIQAKFDQIIGPQRLGGAMAWSLAEDSEGWSHLLAMQAAVKNRHTHGKHRRRHDMS
ncbi:glycoside hydrolase superfamily [Lasiosphaeria miniovina]|uniref:chitinase n=1 Tax=Lasiosphaeria miniovina TaxID=1954250 RepID=A0AA40EAK2_9PEZI|nr:glycoside hydrolase superfamily [Lasiosphaeria miniovina]KAK0734494.1 glycoside hydrolase superfamily [Lasiosphaeria miniovina]